jgi:hypothetical protein
MLVINHRHSLIPLRFLVLVALVYGSAALADTDQDGLLSTLKTKYPITQTSPDRSQIAQGGIVMHVVKNGISARPWDSLMNFDNPIVDGAVQQRSRWVELTQSTEARLGQGKNLLFLKPGDKVYITRIEAKTESKDDLLKISILSYKPLDVDDGASQKRYAATLCFKMHKKSLSESAPEEVERMVEAMLAPDPIETRHKQNSVASATHTKSHSAAAAAAPAPAAPTPAAPTQNIAMGQTINQVVAIMGQPQQIVDLGAKKTYTYSDLKIVFVDGKVNDVQ